MRRGLLAVFLLIVASVSSSWGFITVPYGGINYTSWLDLGIIYGAGEPPKAYYVRVLYDPSCFETGCGVGKPYKMWYGNQSGQIMYAESVDGFSWSPPSPTYSDNPSIGPKYHHVVVYDPARFGEPDGPYYKMWFWNLPNIYGINAIGYAESIDGIHWENITTITQGSPKLVEGISSTRWNKGSYGPVEVIYNPAGSSTLDSSNPLNNRYVMYYDGTNGAEERIGLAMSVDGIHWVAYDGDGDGYADPVLDCSQPWEYSGPRCYVGYGSIVKDNDGLHLFYSGGDRVNQGIGYAFSTNGVDWSKYSGNPLLHVSDPTTPPGYRSKRTYTPSVIFDGIFKMYYSAKSNGGDYAIGIAVNLSPITITTTVTTTETSTDTETLTLTSTMTSTFTLTQTTARTIVRSHTVSITLWKTLTETHTSLRTTVVKETSWRTLLLTETMTSTLYLDRIIRENIINTVTSYSTVTVTSTHAKGVGGRAPMVSVPERPGSRAGDLMTVVGLSSIALATAVVISVVRPNAFCFIGEGDVRRGKVSISDRVVFRSMLGGKLLDIASSEILGWEEVSVRYKGRTYPGFRLSTSSGEYVIGYLKGFPEKDRRTLDAMLGNG